MLQYIHVAVDLLALDKLREALSAYRNHIQHFSPGSFQVVVDTLLTRANEKVVQPVHGDLPTAALLASVEDKGEESAHRYLSFLWDVYGVLLDLIKSNGKLVQLYAFIVTSALEFCAKNGLRGECLKLGQALRSHLLGASKMTEQRSEGSQTLSYAIDLMEMETALALIQVRLTVIETMMKMNLLDAALQQAEDIASFRQYFPSIPLAEEVRLWSLLSSWFFATGNLTLHAYLQQHLYWTTLKYSRTATSERLDALRNLAVISSLAASTYEAKGVSMSRFTALLKLGIIPRRHLLLEQCKRRGLLDSIDPSIRSVFALLEEQYAPLSLVESVRNATAALPSAYSSYVPSLNSVACEIALQQVSHLYQRITLPAFMRALQLPSQAEAERRLLQAISSGAVSARIDHQRGLVEFPQGEGLSGFCQQLSQISALFGQFKAVVQPVRPAAVSMREVLATARENRQVAEKQEAAEKLRKERLLLQQEEEELARKRELELKSKAEASSADLRKKMDVEQQKQKLNVQRRQLYLEEIEFWVEKMRKEGFSSKEMRVKGKKIKDMTDDEKIEVGFEEFIALHKKLFEAARQAREEQMQQASRQLQYRERAKREVEAEALQKQWQAEQETEVQRFIEQHKLSFQQDLALKHAFAVAVPYKRAFVQSEIEKALIPFNQQYSAWVKQQADVLSQSIVEVAQELREESRKRQREAKRLEYARNIEPEVKSKQDEAKRRLLEESRLKSKETGEEWRTPKTPASAAKKYFNTKKKADEPQKPLQVKEEVKKQEPPSPAQTQVVSKWTRPVDAAARPEVTTPKPVDLKPASERPSRLQFKNSKK